MTNEQLAKEITYALIRDGHVHNSAFNRVFGLIKKHLDEKPGHA